MLKRERHHSRLCKELRTFASNDDVKFAASIALFPPLPLINMKKGVSNISILVLGDGEYRRLQIFVLLRIKSHMMMCCAGSRLKPEEYVSASTNTALKLLPEYHLNQPSLFRYLLAECFQLTGRKAFIAHN